MVTVFVILGDANTRKSSAVRALTGVPRRKEVTVATNGGNIDVFVQISSLQESEVLPDAFISEMAEKEVKNVLVTVWISSLFKNDVVYPPGSEYLGAFAAVGWRIRQIVVLGTDTVPDAMPTDSPTPVFFPLSSITPVNRTAAEIRSHWGWE